MRTANCHASLDSGGPRDAPGAVRVQRDARPLRQLGPGPRQRLVRHDRPPEIRRDQGRLPLSRDSCMTNHLFEHLLMLSKPTTQLNTNIPGASSPSRT